MKNLPPPVAFDRWREAQRWEKEFWDRQNVPPPWWKRALRPLLVLVGLRRPLQSATFDDRNEWWREEFDGYRMIPSSLGAIAELGCGPYTNTRLVLQDRSASRVVCSDPLAATYITYPNGWLANSHRQGKVEIDTHAAEDCPLESDAFDVVIMINVLDHVRDVGACLENAARITRPGGLFVFGQDLTSDDDEHPANPGHPFVVEDEQLTTWLDPRFERVYYRLIPRERLHDPEMHYGALAYVGRKR